MACPPPETLLFHGIDPEQRVCWAGVRVAVLPVPALVFDGLLRFFFRRASLIFWTALTEGERGRLWRDSEITLAEPLASGAS
jgi:hypothetical protein